MTKGPLPHELHQDSSGDRRGFTVSRTFPAFAVLGAALLSVLAGCQAPDAGASSAQVRAMQEASKAPDVLTIREGDVLKIAFPGAPNLDSTQTVRRDGRITLGVIGEVKVAGLAPADLEKQLIEQFSSQLVSKEVTVTVVSSTFTVFVAGAVIHPGKVISDHPLTALEAVMEAGGFDNAKADLKAVVVIRNEDGHTKNYTVDLKSVLDGQQSQPFYLKPSDIVYLPERFSWF